MSTRVKVFLIITGIVLLITLSSMLISIKNAQDQILSTLETNMEMLANAANEYVMGEMILLKNDAAAVSFSTNMLISGYPPHQRHEFLSNQLFAYDDFEAIALYNYSGSLVARDGMGGVIPPLNVINEYKQFALDGLCIFTTTNNVNGEMVFFIFVPYDDSPNPGFMCITVSGIYFSEKMKQLISMNPSGIVSILDENGTIIADMNEAWVEERLNFFDRIKPGNKKNDASREKIINIIENEKSNYLSGSSCDDMRLHTETE